MSTPYCVVYVTAPKGGTSKKIVQTILRARSAVCINIIPSVESHFWWKKKVRHENESLLIIKTRQSKLEQLFSLIRSVHPSTTPEMIALPIVAGFKPYLDWIHAETK